MSIRRQAVAAAVIASGLLLVGCGSDDSGDEAATATTGAEDTAAAPSTVPADEGEEAETGGDACDIVSDEVAAEVLGIEIVRREATGEAGAASVGCIKGSERTGDPTGFSYVSVGVTANGAALVDEAGVSADSVVVDGLGDHAVYLPSAGALFVADGTDAVQIQVVLAGVPGSQDDAVAVATDVFDRRD